MGHRRVSQPSPDAVPTDVTIPFNRPSLVGNELEYVAESLRSGRTSSSGPFSARAAKALQGETGAAEVLLTTSCTTALEMAALMLDVHPGDTVVVPSFTFVSTALAFARQGACVRFCDIESTTLGLDPDRLAELMDDRVKAVVPVHYAGVPCAIDRISAVLAERPEVALIEDNSHGLYGSWKGRPLGSFGRFATLSFHETKNIVCGEGGALLVNDYRDVDRARVLYDKGTDRRAFMLGQVDKYTWRDTGSSFGMSDVLAAYLLAQLERADQIQAKRARVYEFYDDALRPIASTLGFRTPHVPEGASPAHHMYYVLLRDGETRDAVLSEMRARGVSPTFHYVPLHSSEAGRRFSDRDADCPVTDDVSQRLLRLPFFNDLSLEDAARVVDTFTRAVMNAHG